MNEKHDTQLVGSAFVFQSMNSTVSMNLSTIFKLKGINFSIGAACIFVIVKAMNKLNRKKEEPAQEPPKESEEVKLLKEIRDALKKK
jgi:large-conductance mechanosensitive channel